MAMFEESEMVDWNLDNKSDALHKQLFSAKDKRLPKNKKIHKNISETAEKSSKVEKLLSRRQKYQKKRKLWQLQKKKHETAKRKEENDSTKEVPPQKSKLQKKKHETAKRKEENVNKNDSTTEVPPQKSKLQKKKHETAKRKEENVNKNGSTKEVPPQKSNPDIEPPVKAEMFVKDKKLHLTEESKPSNKKKLTKSKKSNTENTDITPNRPKRERNKYKHLAGKDKKVKKITPESFVSDSKLEIKLGSSGSSLTSLTSNILNISREGKRKKKRLTNGEGESLLTQKKQKKQKLDVSLESIDMQVDKTNLEISAIIEPQESSAKLAKQKRKRKLDSNERGKGLSPKRKEKYAENALDSKSDITVQNQTSKKKKRGEQSTTSTKTKKGNLKEETLLSKSPFNIDKLKSVLGKKGSQTMVDTPVPNKQDKEDKSSQNIASKKSPKTKQGEGTLRERMENQLKSSRFRYLNEQLYTTTSKEAKNLFKDDEDAFRVYHEGFQSQVLKWPVNPVEKMVEYIQSRSKTLVVADFGCGDAKIAKSVPNKVHSFDLVATNEHVTACDIAEVPLSSQSVDIVVLCLALMGTNLEDFVLSANRVLKTGGILLVAEVVSRFEKLGSFVRKLRNYGFSLECKDSSNKMFVWLEFVKTSSVERDSKLPEIQLMPCVYKKR